MAEALPPVAADVIKVHYFELYGGKIGAAAKQYTTDPTRFGWRLFDLRASGFELTPWLFTVDAAELPADIEKTSAWLAERLPATLVALDPVLAAPAAQAAANGVVSVVETTKVQYKAKKGQQNRVVVTRSGRTITVDDRVALKVGKGCKAVKGDKTKISCTPKTAPTRVRVYTYDRNDSVVNRTDLPMTADGGTGNDWLSGDDGRDALYGEH